MNKKIFLLALICVLGVAAVLPTQAASLDKRGAVYSWYAQNWLNQILIKLQKKIILQSQKKNAAQELPTISNSWHNNIITTVFWVGEQAGPDNGYISNADSAWDEMWLEHSPKENQFYVALPYTDFDENGRKQNAKNIPWYDAVLAKQDNYSFVKNRWVEIKNSQGKSAYAQVEDAGPYESDDFAYVFGSAAPKNKIGAKAGLDVSPKVMDYLGLTGLDKTGWRFIDSAQVPDGPWKQTITESGCFWY